MDDLHIHNEYAEKQKQDDKKEAVVGLQHVATTATKITKQIQYVCQLAGSLHLRNERKFPGQA